ncbi:MAG: hypothetical protein O9282_09925 [Flavobacterium sp.]|uniref:hypothetical protein n=1 Tax=Flavobacterium sp. TaxID=239 RepID=UPI0022C51C69|nr:hypothetical protein [Flavobacterium sp.]MCZ8331617.1 hypothetical protein [Flavobacterium sp.]
MAQLKANNKISGAIGNVVFRTVNGKQIIQSKSGPIQQSDATKISGSEFRQCSQWAKILRNGYFSFLAGMTDSYIHGRLTAAIYKAILHNTTVPKGERTPQNSDMSYLNGFEMNTNSLFTSYFLPEITVTPTAENQIRVSIAPFEAKSAITFPPETTHVDLLLYAMATNFDTNAEIIQSHLLLPITKNQSLPETEWIVPAPPLGYLSTINAKLLFYQPNALTGRTDINTKQLSPAIIVSAKNE